MGLIVDIKKKLPGFHLQVKLSCEHEITGILGASGAGKSMLLSCIAGLVKPDEGTILLNDKVFFDSSKKINLPPRERKVGFLFQNYALFPHLTISENIGFGLGELSESEKNKKVSEMMDRFHLEEMGSRYPSQISGGQQQRVALARGMAYDPEILLLDEPFSALDDYLRTHMIKETLEYLKEFKGCTLCVTHNMEEAYRLCDKIAIIKTGSLETFGSKKEIFEKPASLEAAKITGCKNMSPAKCKGENILAIPGWGIELVTSQKIEKEAGFAGIRANFIQEADESCKENCFPVWIADESEAPFRTTLYLKIGSEPSSRHDYHLQWEISKNQRDLLKDKPLPLKIYMNPAKVLFVTN